MEEKLTYAMLQAISIYNACNLEGKLINLDNLPFFDSDESYVSNTIKYEFNTYGINDVYKSLSKLSLSIEDNKDLNVENIKLIISNILSNYEYLKTLSEDARNKKIKLTLDTFKKLIAGYYLNNELKQKDNYIRSFETFAERIKYVIEQINNKYSIKSRENEVSDWFSQELDLTKAVERKCIGWNALDTMYGDPEDKESKGVTCSSLNVIMGPPGGGKTSTLINIASRAIKNGKSVLFFTFEENKEDLAVYILQSSFEKTRYEIKKDINLFNNKWHDIMSEKNSRLWLHNGLISREGEGSINLNLENNKKRVSFFSFTDIYNIVKYVNEKTKEQTGKGLDFVLFDYLNKMAQMIKEDNLYEKVGNVAIGLKEIARYFRIPVFVAHQFNRGGLINKDIGMENTSDSNMVNFEADSIIALKESNQDKNMLFFKALKNRHGIKNMKIYALPDFRKKVINFISEDSTSEPKLDDNDLSLG